MDALWLSYELPKEKKKGGENEVIFRLGLPQIWDLMGSIDDWDDFGFPQIWLGVRVSVPADVQGLMYWFCLPFVPRGK